MGASPGGRLGQSAVEYVLLLVAAIMAAVGLRTYLQLTVQGRLNDARWSIIGDSVPVDTQSGSGMPYTWTYAFDSTEVTTGKLTARTNSVVGRQRILGVQVDGNFTECTREGWGAANVTCP